jgi:hypothetical protein
VRKAEEARDEGGRTLVVDDFSTVALAHLIGRDPTVRDVTVDTEEAEALVGDSLEEGRASARRRMSKARERKKGETTHPDPGRPRTRHISPGFRHPSKLLRRSFGVTLNGPDLVTFQYLMSG